MKQEFRQSPWRTVLGFAAAYAATAVAIVACAPSASSPTVATHGDRNTLVRIEDAPTITDARLCAAVAAYSAATGDHWDQRALIAHAALNRFRTLGHVPDCGGTLTVLVANGIEPHLWQAALDAVDAVQSGSFAIPVACARADTVVRSPADAPVVLAGIPPVAAPAARAQCVIAGLAFVEGAR